VDKRQKRERMKGEKEMKDKEDKGQRELREQDAGRGKGGEKRVDREPVRRKPRESVNGITMSLPASAGSLGTSDPDIPDSFYYQYMTPDQQSRFAAILRSPDLMKLDTEIARMKTLASNLETNDTSERNVKLLVSVHDLIGRLVSSRHKMLFGDRHFLTVQNLSLIMRKVVQVIERHVENPATRQAIAQDLLKVHKEE